jgi:CMP-N,N'-diacetyllegionaminic acid synthase
MTMKYVAIIPARAGSKRLPGKNMLEIGGLPLIGFTLRAALKSTLLSRVVVTSDDESLLEWTRQAGAHQSLRRPASLATDTAETIDVVKDVLYREEAAGRPIEAVVLLQPTSPLRTAEDIDSAIRLHQRAPDRGLVSVAEVKGSAKWTGPIRDGLFELGEETLEDGYRLNGAIYICSTDRILREESFLVGRLTPYVMPAYRSIDVDTREDFLEVLKRFT